MRLRVPDLVHATHSVGVVALATACIAGHITDTAVVAASSPYMVLDLVAHYGAGNRAMVAHHVATLLLYALGAGSRAPWLHLPSRMLLIEASVPLLLYWKRKRASRWRWWALVIGYGLNRVVYLGYSTWSRTQPGSLGLALGYWEVTAMVWIARLMHVGLCVWFGRILGTKPRTADSKL